MKPKTKPLSERIYISHILNEEDLDKATKNNLKLFKETIGGDPLLICKLKDVKQFIKEILEEIELKCKPHDMLYGEVGNKKLSFEEIKQIIIQKAGRGLVE